MTEGGKCFSEDLKRKIESHLTNQKDEFLRYFPDVEPQNSIYKLARNPFLANVENLPYELQEEATEMQFNSLAKDSLESFWPTKFTYIGSICINVPLRNGILSTYGTSYAASQQVNMN
ncbi:hypothetical protein T12_13594 [Trichinella patagoniensis]|uniref:Uncharacterized protein n=1 Tax=Trichinella patagoniensis TaxID=990121 RepID=A0A0V0Z9M5_9BILA|nr:hypothetical protein T12_13594 [Trichinella patagoniensis]